MTVKSQRNVGGPFLASNGGSILASAEGEDDGGERKYGERHSQRLEQYYDEVISQLGQPEALHGRSDP